MKKNKDRTDRYDAVIEANGIPVGLLGLLSIDYKNKKAEYYIMLGEREYLGKGIAANASRVLLEYAFHQLELNRVYLYVETENFAAAKSYERIGFKREGTMKNDLFSKGRFVDRYVYGIAKKDFYRIQNTMVHWVDEILGNQLYMKQEDFIPISFGGNKARKAELFFKKIDHGDYDCVVTYGSSSSNHCRIIANMAASREMKCYIISPEEASEETYNSKMMKFFGGEITVCSVSEVHNTIETKLSKLRNQGHKPYFIAGGGHGNIGTQAYVNCYEEIRQYEREQKIHFDYIFHASGTGTTQAGLVCGQLVNRDDRKIIGISIARKNPRGRNIVLDSVKEYLQEQRVFIDTTDIEKFTVFLDDYIGDGYGKSNAEIEMVIERILKKYHILMDATYTGKAFYGMQEHIKNEDIRNKNILFIHTGGTPLFFDYLNHKNQDKDG